MLRRSSSVQGDGWRVPLLTLVTPELTSLSIDKTALAQHAIELVDNILSSRSPAGSCERRRIGLTLVVRESA